MKSLSGKFIDGPKRSKGSGRSVKARQEKQDLFVYGTLMNNHHVQLLFNRKVESVPATLYNYMRITPNGGFFFIVKQNGAKTVGRILKDLTPEEVKRLDKFENEGVLYFRRVVTVRLDEERHRCLTYVGNIEALQRAFGSDMKFEDRFSMYLENKIDEIISQSPAADEENITRKALRELMGSEVDSIIQSHFDGNYICNYIMIKALEDAVPPRLKDVMANPELKPYAANYMRLACQHIVFNQFVELIRHQFLDAVRMSQQYFRHGLAILLGFMYYNQKKDIIGKMFHERKLDVIVPDCSYRKYAQTAIEIVEEIYEQEEMLDIIDFVESNWYSTPTPIGAELEFSHLGKRAVTAEPGEDSVYDSFFWFGDFDMYRRTWRLGGHVDSHRHITAGQVRYRGFFEYALGRYQIVGDLSRPLFDCPWGLSQVINEAVKFLDIPPHSLHVSMELSRGLHSHITSVPHEEENLICLMLLGGDLRSDAKGKMREWRIFDKELDTNFTDSLHFSDRKYHFSKPDQDQSEASDTMEFKFMRLHQQEFDYESLIVALKGYQINTHARPLSIQTKGKPELPEQVFLRKWSANPQPVDQKTIRKFVDIVEQGLLEENRAVRLSPRKKELIKRIANRLECQNRFLADSR